MSNVATEDASAKELRRESTRDKRAAMEHKHQRVGSFAVGEMARSSEPRSENIELVHDHLRRAAQMKSDQRRGRKFSPVGE
jgi:hypothetical protein